MAHMVTHYDDDVLGERPSTPDTTAPSTAGTGFSYSRTCRVCDKPFTTTHPHWLTCSYECSRSWPEYRDERDKPNVPLIMADHLLDAICPGDCDLDNPCHVDGCDLPPQNHPTPVTWEEYRAKMYAKPDDGGAPEGDGEGTPGWGAQDGDPIGRGMIAVDGYAQAPKASYQAPPIIDPDTLPSRRTPDHPWADPDHCIGKCYAEEREHPDYRP